MSKQPSLRKSYRDKGFVQRRFARFVCWLFSEHSFIELERGYVEADTQVFKCNKLVCRDCGYET
jgi:hypothetical protein